MFFDFDERAEEEIVGNCCHRCGDTPCRWVHYRLEMIRRVEAVCGAHLHTIITAYLVKLVLGELERREEVMRACRNYAFKAMCFLVHGSLGRDVRIRHTPCVEEGVCNVWPPPGGKITGFRDE